MSTAYYDANAQAYFSQTIGLDMGEHYERFLKHIPLGGAILDAGCGPGRDAREFQLRGYRVTGIDASVEMVRLARAYTNSPIFQMRFEEMSFDSEFDGIWACASLVHVPRLGLPNVLRRFAAALRRGGICYASLKYGEGEYEQDGRRFTCLTEVIVADLLNEVPAFLDAGIWISRDVRPYKSNEMWLNALLQRD